MPTTLWDKVTSFTNYAAWQLGQSITTQPTKNGTDTTTMATIPFFLRSANTNLVSAADSPFGGNGTCWEFRGQTSAGGYGSTDAFLEADGLHYDMGGNTTNKANYVVGFWAKFNHQPTSTYRFFTFGVVSGPGFGIDLYSNGTLGIQNKLGTITDLTSSPLTQNVWHYFVYRRTGNNIKFYLNNVEILSLNGVGSTESGTFDVLNIRAFNALASTGKYLRIHGLHVSPNTSLTTTAQTEIYNAGIQPPSTNISFTTTPGTATALSVIPTVSRGVNFVETPAIATNAHFPEPAASTTTGISFGTEPATANAEISYLTVSGNANFEHSFASSTAILAVPTLAFTFNDNTEIVTSITATALMVNPSSVVASANVSNAADVTTASADIGTHNIIAGVSQSFPAEEATASALFVEPLRFGPDDTTETATPFIASVATGTNTVFVTPNYPNFVKRNNPLLYIRDYSGGNATLLNEGSLNFGTLDKGIAGSTNWSITQQPSGNPLAFIGNGTSPSIRQPVSSSQGRFRYTDATFWGATLAQMYANKGFTHEFWYKPVNLSSGSGSSNSIISYNDGCLVYTLSHLPTSVSFAASFRSDLGTTTFNSSAASSVFTSQNWHHVVVLAEPNGSTQMKLSLYVNGALISTSTQTFLHTLGQIQGEISGNSLAFEIYVGSDSLYGSYDELAIYPNTLSNSEITTHYNFVDTLSPNRIIAVDEMTAEAQSLDATILVVANKTITDTPITATSLFVDPIIGVSRTLDATALTASALSVNPSFYGTPDYRQDAVPMIASAEKGNNSFALDGTYYSYVQLNIAPFRYVSFDSENPYFDHGSDNDYSVTPTSVGGTITNAANGLNNKSAKTAGTSYVTDGVILKESEWNDTWGTGQNTNHSSFWMQRAGNDESSTGIRVLWNLNGYKDNQHAILYQNNNKLHMQFNNGSGTFVDQATVADVNLFDYERHHVVIVFDHTNNNNNNVKLYVDSVLVMTVSLGAYTGTTTNYATSQPANDETYNKPRLGIGCLITPFASTALSAQPQNTILYIDEIHWAVTGLNQTQVTNLYNIMPIKDSVEWYADVFLALNSTFVNPTFGTGNTRSGAVLTASADIVQPQVSVVFNNTINATPITATALKVVPSFFGDNITNIVRSAEFMLASAFMNESVVTITAPGQPMIATVEFAMSTNPYLDPYRLLILDQTLFQTFAGSSFGGSYGIGDVD